VYADESTETFDGFPVYRRLDNTDMIIFRQCRNSEDDSCEEYHPWVLARGTPSHELEVETQSDPISDGKLSGVTLK